MDRTKKSPGGTTAVRTFGGVRSMERLGKAPEVQTYCTAEMSPAVFTEKVLST
jgi:hypothetical protein